MTVHNLGYRWFRYYLNWDLRKKGTLYYQFHFKKRLDILLQKYRTYVSAPYVLRFAQQVMPDHVDDNHVMVCLWCWRLQPPVSDVLCTVCHWRPF